MAEYKEKTSPHAYLPATADFDFKMSFLQLFLTYTYAFCSKICPSKIFKKTLKYVHYSLERIKTLISKKKWISVTRKGIVISYDEFLYDFSQEK